MNRKTILRVIAVLTAFSVFMLTGCEHHIKRKEKISVYLWNTQLLTEFAPYIQKKIPDADIEFVVGNNDLDFYKFLNENGKLPDIITTRRFSMNDADSLKNSLMDLSETEEAASVYMTYLSSFQNSDGTVNWLPVCGVADNIIANKALFDKYNIPLPTDYNSFVSACKEFEKAGIRGFISDFSYDYTCMEVLQGVSAFELASPKGKRWRLKYADPGNGENGLDKEIWPHVFENMEQFINDVKLVPEDAELGFDNVIKMFREEKAAMIRGTAADIYDDDMEDLVLLPYFCPSGDSWLLTYPSFHVALNKELEHSRERKELAMRVLKIMFSEEGQNVLTEKNDMISYCKNINLELSDRLSSIRTNIESNHIFIRIASDRFFDVSKDVVQKMITGDYDAERAYEVFDIRLNQPDNSTNDIAAVFNSSYPYEFQNDGGNPAASAVANTLRKYYKSDILISPSYNFTGPVLKTAYSKKMLDYMIMPNSCEAFNKEMTGKEIKALLRESVKGTVGEFSPFNRSTLPVVSGAFIEVKENEKGKYTLTEVLSDGKPLDDNASYKVTYLNPVFYCNPIALKLYPKLGIKAFKMQNMRVRDAWTKYITDGNDICKPTDYITLKQ